MINPLSYIEKFLYRIRDFFWYYPDLFWGTDEAFSTKFSEFYLSTRPFSHLALALVLCVLFTGFAFTAGQYKIFAGDSSVLLEGVVVGVDENGSIQKLSKVNPLLPTSIQLEKDLNELIYEPLIRYEDEATIEPVLAESIDIISQGSDYQFNLKPEIFWHDGRKFGVEDVIATLNLIAQLDKPHDETSYVQAVKQMAWERSGLNSLRICTMSPEIRELPLEQRTCSGATTTKPILANFLELTSFKIMPAHLIGELNTRNIDKPEPAINRFPIGTGAYKFGSAADDRITLFRNENYHEEIANIHEIDFKLFANQEDAIHALQNGEIHTFSTTSTQHLRDLDDYLAINTYTSPVLTTQYWALYFNLRKDLNENPIGPEFFQDQKVRQAISAAINRERLIQVLLGVGEEAVGPIYQQSEYFNEDAAWSRYDKDLAMKLLDEAGWVMDENLGIRRKDNKLLSFKISYADNFDRDKLVKSIQQDLQEVGIEVVTDKRDLKQLSSEVLTVKNFDTILYGVSTFIDPDRYELFYSSQQLNLASYAGTEQTVKIEGNRTVRLPRVDRLLEQGRSFDPVAAKEARKETYDRFQELLAVDAPAVFLYHPQFIYYANRRVKQVNLEDAMSLEQRFRNVAKWEIE